MELEELSSRVREMHRKLLEEVRLTSVGLKDASEIARIFEAYQDLASEEVIEAAERGWRRGSGQESERWRILYFFCQGLSLEQSSVKLGDQLLNELMRETVSIEGKEVPYFGLRNLLVNEKDAARRELIHEKLVSVIAKTNPTRKKIVSAEKKALTAQTGAQTAIRYLQAQKKIEYAPLLSLLQSAVEDSNQLYQHHVGRWAKEVLGQPLGEISQAHLGYLLKMPQFDELFPDKDLLLVCGQTLDNLGCNLAAIPQIKVDDSDRPKKNPRASCIPTDPPTEIHLIIKPVGGADDYHQFLHEAGHALHFALLDPSLAYEFRGLGTSNALTEVYSFLLESLTRHPLWLRQYLGMGEELAWEVAYRTTLFDLTMFRRYVGKFEYEMSFYENPEAWQQNSQKYQQVLTQRTGFVYPKQLFLDDIDGGLYVADYLRAWITAAQLRSYLSATFGEAWFMEVAAGAFLKELWSKGLSIENEDISRIIGAKPFATSALLQEYHDVLTGNPA